MTAENTRAALPGDLVARLRDHRRLVGLAHWVDVLEAADALAARDAEIARLRADCETWAAEFDRAMGEAQRLRAALLRHGGHKSRRGWNGGRHCNCGWEELARAALSPPPASDGECCQRTRLRGAPCPAGRTCPHDGGAA